MQLRFSEHRNALIVALEGELDHHSSEMVRVKIDNKIEEMGTNNIIFDFSGVNFMDSSGIGVVIGRYKKVVDFGGRVGMINLKPSIKRVFELSGLLKLIKEYNNLEEAFLK